MNEPLSTLAPATLDVFPIEAVMSSARPKDVAGRHAMGLAPGVGDGLTAGLVAGEAIVEAVTVGGGDHQHVAGLRLRRQPRRTERDHRGGDSGGDLDDAAKVRGGGGRHGGSGHGAYSAAWNCRDDAHASLKIRLRNAQANRSTSTNPSANGGGCGAGGLHRSHVGTRMDRPSRDRLPGARSADDRAAPRGSSVFSRSPASRSAPTRSSRSSRSRKSASSRPLRSTGRWISSSTTASS